MMRGTMSNGISRSAASSLAIDGKGDAGLAEHALGIAHLLGQPRRILRLQPAIVGLIGIAQPGIRRLHLVEGCHAHSP